MLLGFKRRFAPFVEDGSKFHTIRGYRKVPPKVGELCHCYVDPRQKTMRLLRRSPCVRFDEIAITQQAGPSPLLIAIADEFLSPDEANELAWRDGFRPEDRSRALHEMAEFWLMNGHQVSFAGHIIYWDPEVNLA